MTSSLPRVRRLILLRHGQTEYNAGDRMQGQLDTDLSELGQVEGVVALGPPDAGDRSPLMITAEGSDPIFLTAGLAGKTGGEAP